MSAPRRKNAIFGQFAARLIEMMESPAYRVLSLSAHRVLSRIEVEYAHHGGQDNGKLPVTFDDFANYGLHRAAIGPAIDEAEALGFIKVTERGSRAVKAEYRRPNKFRLTSRPADGQRDGTHDWRRFATMEEAAAAAAGARRGRRENLKAASTKNVLKTVRTPHQNLQIASTENVLP
jgi:hypothetical protein